MKSSIATIALLAATAAAKTDFDGCTSFTSMVTARTEIGYGNTYATVIWYDPSNLELCQGVDCGGGRAPPKTVPGCPAYSGTETVEPTFLSEDPANPKPTTTETVAETTSTEEPSSSEEEEEEETKGADDGDDAAAGSTAKTTAPPAKTTATPSPSSSGDEQETPSATSGGEEGGATSTDAGDGASLPTAALNMVAGVAAIVALL
jgi:hypothetical protein